MNNHVENNKSDNSKVELTYSSVLSHALRALFYPKIISSVVFSLIVASFIFALISFVLWSPLVELIKTALTPLQTDHLRWMPLVMQDYVLGKNPLFIYIALIVVFFFLFIPLTIIVGMFISSLLASTYLIKYIGRRDYPDLSIVEQSSLLTGLKRIFIYTIAFIFLNILTWPISVFFPFIAPLLSLAIVAWYNLKIASYDILSLYCHKNTIKDIENSSYKQAYVLSLLSSMTLFLPLAVFVTPIANYVTLTCFYLSYCQKRKQLKIV